jgi:uncharacterized protein DUF707
MAPVFSRSAWRCTWHLMQVFQYLVGLKVKRVFTACWYVIPFRLKSDLLCISNMWFWPGLFSKSRSGSYGIRSQKPYTQFRSGLNRHQIWSGIRFWTSLIFTNYMLVRSLASNLTCQRKYSIHTYECYIVYPVLLHSMKVVSSLKGLCSYLKAPCPFQNDLVHGWGLDMKLGYCAQVRYWIILVGSLFF